MNTTRPLIGIPLTPRCEPHEAPGDTQSGGRAYAEAIYSAGGLPVFLPLSPPEAAPDFIAPLDGLLLPGGGDVDPALFGEAPHPELGTVSRALDEWEIALARLAAELDLPTLGICRGEQVLNVARGGTLVQHIPDQVPGALKHGGNHRTDDAHAIRVPAGTHLARILGAGSHAVNSTHHQSVKDIAPGLRVAATCPEDGVIEAIEDPDSRFCLGVQFHPEQLPHRFAPLFSAFVDACRNGMAAGGNGRRWSPRSANPRVRTPR